MSSAEKVVKLQVLVLALTLKAVLVEYEGEQIWIPRSAMVDDEMLTVDIKREQQIKVLTWLAAREGFI